MTTMTATPHALPSVTPRSLTNAPRDVAALGPGTALDRLVALHVFARRSLAAFSRGVPDAWPVAMALGDAGWRLTLEQMPNDPGTWHAEFSQGAHARYAYCYDRDPAVALCKAGVAAILSPCIHPTAPRGAPEAGDA